MPSLKLISATDTQYSAAVLKSMNDQRSNGIFCDVTIIIQDKKFRAHKTILSASSTYFHQLFAAAGQVIELNFTRAEIFEEILNYIYTAKLQRVRSDLLEEIINAGQVLGVKFIANLKQALSQVKGLPGLSKESDSKNDSCTEIVPIITEAFSISAEEFDHTSRSGSKDEDSDDDVEFVSEMDAQAAARKKARCQEVIDLDSADSTYSASKTKNEGAEPAVTEAIKPPVSAGPDSTVSNSSPQQSPDGISSSFASPARPPSEKSLPTAASSPASASHPFENTDVMGVQRKQVSTSQQGDFKIRLLDVSKGPADPPIAPNPGVLEKKTVTLNAASEIDSIPSGCKVYANIGTNTYDIVPLKEDPDEGGSKVNKGKRSLMATPLKPLDKAPAVSPKSSPSRKKTKTELEDHYELIMDGKTFYVCVVCKRPYVCLTSLRRHFNTHSWEKKYQCRYCSKVFALAEYRTKHEITHTGERRYQCLLCEETFLNYQVLSTHCKQAHNQDPSGRKEKDDTNNNLYRLLPCKSVQMKPYSWSNEGSGVPIISEDGSVRHVVAPPPQPPPENVHPTTQGRMLNWDDMFIEPGAHMPPGIAPSHPPLPPHPPPPLPPPRSMMHNPPKAATEFDFVIPETY